MKNKLFKTIAFTAAAALAVSASPELQISATSAAEDDTKLIALTFDDGPNTTTTNEILDLLETYNAKATFFLIGSNINDESAQSVKRAYDMGCEIANHSKTHSNMGGMSAEEIAEEIAYVDEKVTEITGEPTKFFRPPFIDVSQTMYDAIDQTFICGIDCKDFMDNVSAQERADYIINNAEDGVIVLLHDAAGNDKTVEAVSNVIPTLQEQGYEFVTLTELFERQGETPKGNMIYSKVAKYPCGNYSLHSTIFEGEASGNTSWSGWSETAVLDGKMLKELGESYAVEVEYDCPDPPVIALQKWSGTVVWTTVQPFYSNGEKACFLAEDIIEALETAGVDYTELDRMTITPSAGTMTMTKASILVKDEPKDTLKGDVNADGEFDIADAVLFQKWLIGDPDAVIADPLTADFCEDGVLNSFDLCIMKRDITHQ